MKRWLHAIWGLCACVGGALHAQSLPDDLARQKRALQSEREAILAQYAQQQADCWQKFAVNACLQEARRTRRQALAPIRQQELDLNAQERLWRTEQREQRLQDKQTDSLGTNTP